METLQEVTLSGGNVCNVLSGSQLKKLCKRQGISSSGKTKETMIDDCCENPDFLSNFEIEGDDYCNENFLPTVLDMQHAVNRFKKENPAIGLGIDKLVASGIVASVFDVGISVGSKVPNAVHEEIKNEVRSIVRKHAVGNYAHSGSDEFWVYGSVKGNPSNACKSNAKDMIKIIEK